ncbi:hypothetical protein EOA19_21385 [Mesorhizobium sp. M7A.F.Ca.US.010.02.1.1]|nr:hypothetical protein EOA19_21385 [Mesorhizobium sp. M7A.F.Ca.US.010.02.1.1]
MPLARCAGQGSCAAACQRCASRHFRWVADRALSRLALRGLRVPSPKCGVGLKSEGTREARAEQDGKAATEELKDKVPCAAVLEHLGFALDVKESTRKGDP